MENQSVSTQLGITQKELALLLKVSRSQLSMFELGRGTLNTSATLLLAKLLNFVKETDVASKRKSSVDEYETEKLEQIKKRLKENYHQQSFTRKKLAVVQQKADIQTKILRFDDFIELLQTQKNDVDESSVEYMTQMVEKAQHDNVTKDFVKHSLKMKVLENEQIFLESLLQQ